MRPRSKQFYDKLGNMIMQHMKNEYSDIKIKKVGSRESDTYKRKSDLDIRFFFEKGNPDKNTFYPKLVNLLKNKLGRIDGEILNYDLGTHRNVVRCRPEKGGKVDLVLVSKKDF